MKRIVLFLLVVSIGMSTKAQSAADTTTTGCDNDTSCYELPSLFLGVNAGVTLKSNHGTPLDAPFGLKLSVPLIYTTDLSPHWNFEAGLRYDFEWSPLRYNVQPAEQGGIGFLTTPLEGRQTAMMFNSHIGVPVGLTWYPWANNHRVLSVAFDIFGGYTVSNYVTIRTRTAKVDDGKASFATEKEVIGHDAMPLKLWKLEAGVMIGSDVLGLVHGVRFAADLLTSYRDPVSGKNIHQFGMTIYF